MTCAGCGFEPPPNASFCPRCGDRLQTACQQCGAMNPPDFAFCPQCGARLPGKATARWTNDSPQPVQAASQPVASDRRVVTVLFADLSGFTALSERLDPEEVRAFQTALFDLATAAIEQFDGFVEKYVGDAVMAVFGAPVSHEDDPERALRAALTMRESVAHLAQEWGPRIGAPLQMHIGVHTGPVVAGALGPSKHAAYAVTGDTVNTAARLQSAAQPGEIVVSAVTQRMTRHAFAFEPRDPLILKGKSAAVDVFRLRSALARPASARGLDSYGLRSSLVGRQEEMTQLMEAFRRAARGRAQVVSVVGDAGQGKSRLITAFLEHLDHDGELATAGVLRVACSSLGERTYGVLVGFLREGFGIMPGDSMETARTKLTEGARAMGADAAHLDVLQPVLGHILGFAEEQHEIEPDALRRQIFAAARTLVELRLALGPVVLVVEDLHWADSASVDLLRYIVERLHDRPLLLVLSYRPGFAPDAVLATRAMHSGIRLAPLSDTDLERILTNFFGSSVSHWPEKLRSLLVGRAGGNPLYLEEIVRSMIAVGHLEAAAQGWMCRGPVEDIEIPATIQGLLLSRLDKVASSARRVLQEAAAIGPVFDYALLRRVASAQGEVDAALETLLDGGLIEELTAAVETGRRFRFAHALLHDATYDNLLHRRRTELHGVIAHALQDSLGSVPLRLEDLTALAHHFSRSAERGRAAEYLLEAGERARSVYANEDALGYFQRALDVLSEREDAESLVLTVHEQLGDLHALLGPRQAALEHYAAARGGWQEAGRDGEVARLLRKTGVLHWDAGERDEALRLLEAGLDLVKDRPEDIEHAHLCQELGRCAFRRGDHHGAAQWAERALALAQPLIGADPALRREAAGAASHAYNTIGISLARTQRLLEAVAQIERGVRIAEEHDLLHAAGRAYTNLGVVYAVLDAQRGIDACSRGLEIAKRIGDAALQSKLYANLAVAYCALSERCDEQGIEAANTSARLDRELDQRDHLAVPLIVLGQIYQCEGNPERALEHYREALVLAEESAEPQLLFPCYDGLGALYLDLGEESEAERYLVQARQVCERSGLNPDGLTVLPFLV